MARFEVAGVDAVSASMADLAQLTEEERYRVLDAGAAVVLEHLTEILRTRFRVITGALSSSLRARHKSGAVIVSPEGKHPGSSTGKRRRKGGGAAGHYSGTNTEIGYYLEYGTPRIKATHWMETGVEECAEETTNAMAEAWDELLREKGL